MCLGCGMICLAQGEVGSSAATRHPYPDSPFQPRRVALDTREIEVSSSIFRTGPVPTSPGAFLSGLRAHSAQLTRSEQKIADFLLQETGEAIRLTITEFASRVDVGEATITRFCQRLGLRGFQDLKIIVAQGSAPDALNSVEIPGEDQMSSVAHGVTRRSMALIADTARLLS